MEIIKSDSLKELSIALSNFQATQKPIKPNATNPFLKNKYADLTALIENTKENLHKNGLSVTQLLCNDGLATVLVHKSGEYIGSTFKIEPTEGKGTNAAQEMGIAITYSRRYAYGAILGLVTDEDTDGSGKNKSTGRNRGNNQSPTQPKTPVESTETGRTEEQAPNKGNGKVISEAQRKRMFAIANTSGTDKETAKKILAVFGYESSNDVTTNYYEKICNVLNVPSLTLAREIEEARKVKWSAVDAELGKDIDEWLSKEKTADSPDEIDGKGRVLLAHLEHLNIINKPE
jgi:hypothetical protein